MYQPGDIVTHTDICVFEGFTVQQGMNFHTGRDNVSVLLMSTAKNSPYDDEVQDGGRTVIYEGHDIRRDLVEGNPKLYDQPIKLPSGKLTANGKFYRAAKNKNKETVRLYEKIKPGIWVYNGSFLLQDAWFQSAGKRRVIKFKLTILDNNDPTNNGISELQQGRMIPSRVKFAVYKRDGGRCVICGAKDNLHFDHIIPFSKGGTSLKEENIQILCARHNLSKGDKII